MYDAAVPTEAYSSLCLVTD